MGLLHYDRWEELGPEMDAFDALTKVREGLVGVNDLAVRDIDRAILRLHPCAKDKEAREEFAARQRGEEPRARRAGERLYTEAELQDAVRKVLQDVEREKLGGANTEPASPSSERPQ